MAFTAGASAITPASSANDQVLIAEQDNWADESKDDVTPRVVVLQDGVKVIGVGSTTANL